MTAQEIKRWLKDRKKTHAWLAEQLYVTVHSVNGWLSSGKKITRAREAQIAAVFHHYDAAGGAEDLYAAEDAAEPDDSVTLYVDRATFDLWDSAAHASGEILRDWATRTLTDAAMDRRK